MKLLSPFIFGFLEHSVGHCTHEVNESVCELANYFYFYKQKKPNCKPTEIKWISDKRKHLNCAFFLPSFRNIIVKWIAH